MERRIYLWIIIGVLFIAALYLIFQVGATGSTSSVVQSATTTAKTAASASSYGGMVGGC